MRLSFGVIPAFLLGLVLCGCLSAVNQSDEKSDGKSDEKPAQRPSKTVNLLDDETLADWDFFLRDRKDNTKQDTTTKKEDVWTVSDGVLRCKGRPIGYLRTKDKYGPFGKKCPTR